MSIEHPEQVPEAVFELDESPSQTEIERAVTLGRHSVGRYRELIKMGMLGNHATALAVLEEQEAKSPLLPSEEDDIRKLREELATLLRKK